MPLTAEQAIEIFQASGNNSEIGRRFGCDEATVRKIKRKQRWRDVIEAWEVQQDASGIQPHGNAAARAEAIPSDPAPERQADVPVSSECGQLSGEDEGVEVADDMAGGEAEVPVRPGPAGNGAADRGIVLTGEGDPLSRFDFHSHGPFSDQHGRRDFWPDTLPPPPQKAQKATPKRITDEDAPQRPIPPEGLAAADARVLLTARQYGRVHIAGGFGGKVSVDREGIMTAPPVEEAEPLFHPERAVNAQLRRGLIEHGTGANTFHLTEAGRAKLAEYDAFLDRMEEWRQARIHYRKALKNQTMRDAYHAEVKGEG